MRIREIAAVRVRYGYQRIHVLLRREGWMINRKRVYRLYKLEGLNLRSKHPRRHVSAAHRDRVPGASAANDQWSMDFVADALFNGKRIRALTVVDNFTRRSLAIEVDSSLRGDQVVNVLDRLLREHGAPKCIRVDNGPEFVSKVLDHWAYRNSVVLDFSRPGKPIDNCYVESFNGRFRDECLNTHWFLSIEDARAKIEAWRLDYNASRPHSALGQLTPLEFAARSAANGGSQRRKLSA
jgi:putative transposase